MLELEIGDVGQVPQVRIETACGRIAKVRDVVQLGRPGSQRATQQLFEARSVHAFGPSQSVLMFDATVRWYLRVYVIGNSSANLRP